MYVKLKTSLDDFGDEGFNAKGLYSSLILLLLQLHEVFPQDREHQTLHPVGNQSCLEATTKQAHHTVFLYHMLHHVDIAGK